jgi:tetratricopeptide (TPR) repeat protein
VKLKVIVVVLAITMLCNPVFGQNSAKDWNDQGGALNSQGKYDEAIQAYDKAIQLDPNYAKAWSNKGMALVNMGKLDEAIQAFDKAIWIDPSLSEAWYHKVNTLDKLGRHEEANKVLGEAIQLEIWISYISANLISSMY